MAEKVVVVKQQAQRVLVVVVLEKGVMEVMAELVERVEMQEAFLFMLFLKKK